MLQDCGVIKLPDYGFALREIIYIDRTTAVQECTISYAPYTVTTNTINSCTVTSTGFDLFN
ncbi:hypothetical protein Leryth_020857 [Lithospermum erythrorhizon]|nr:hypothetical protein Leryth_020857 [Lithospermum erythrorhizon]